MRIRLPFHWSAFVLAVSLSCGGGERITAVTVASVSLQPDSVVLAPGASAQFTVSVRDGAGAAITGRVISWTTSDPARATVTQAGSVSALAPGRVTITATCEGKVATALAIINAPVPAARDFAIVAAQFTQGVQDASGTIPMVLAGHAAVVNVLLSAASPSSTSMQVVLRLFNDAGVVVRTDTAVTRATIDATPAYVTPTVQFLVPAATLQSGLKWQVARDPRGLVTDDTAANDVYPRTGLATLATIDVPTLNVRFVPIVLASHGNATGAVSDASIPAYLRTVRSVLPIGRINAHVGTPLTTSASFGTAPTGGGQAFWTQVLSELDLSRVADSVEPDFHWYGVVVPPSGFNFATFGGWSYIPSSYTSFAARTRTSTGVQINWFSNVARARELVAHELSHTFGRLHAPCGDAGGPSDPTYPVANGTLDIAGHDVYSWANGLTASAPTLQTTTGDVMGYCSPVWSSAYTYKGILQFRSPPIVATEAPLARERVLVVRGVVDRGRAITFEPSFTLDARPSTPEPRGSYRLQGFGASHVLFSYDFEPARLDHSAAVRHFTVAVPSTREIESALDSVVVRGPEGRAVMSRPPASLRTTPRQTAVTAIRRGSAGTLAATCADQTTRAALMIDAATGSILGIASERIVLANAPPGARLIVLCSDGIQTARETVVAPS